MVKLKKVAAVAQSLHFNCHHKTTSLSQTFAQINVAIIWQLTHSTVAHPTAHEDNIISSRRPCPRPSQQNYSVTRTPVTKPQHSIFQQEEICFAKYSSHYATMVYYQPPKRDLQRRRNEVLTMIHLPDELILDCMDHLATLDVLHLRLTHSGLAPAGNTALQQRLKRLYIHPSDLSLLTAVKICAHPMFSQEIQEVVLLGTIEHSKVNEEIEIFWPWPRTFPKPRDQPSTAVLTQSANGTFSDIYRPLMDGLSSLPNVRKLSYAKRVKSPGFNQTRAETIRSHVQRPLNGRWNDWQGKNRPSPSSVLQ